MLNVKKDKLPFRTFHDRPFVASKGLDFDGVISLTREEFAQENDLNCIVPSFLANGAIDPSLVKNLAKFVDCTTFDSYDQMMILQAEAKSNFERLPSHIRDYFGGNMTRFYEFMNDPSNRVKAQELGLVAPSEASAEPGANVNMIVKNDNPDQGSAHKDS